MNAFSQAAILGLCFGLLWGMGCTLAIMYSIYLAGYRKAIKESLKPVKPERYAQVLETILAKKAKKIQRKAEAAAIVAEANVTAEPTTPPPSQHSSQG
jgi:hypothetical protein